MQTNFNTPRNKIRPWCWMPWMHFSKINRNFELRIVLDNWYHNFTVLRINFKGVFPNSSSMTHRCPPVSKIQAIFLALLSHYLPSSPCWHLSSGWESHGGETAGALAWIKATAPTVQHYIHPTMKSQGFIFLNASFMFKNVLMQH